MIYCYQQVCDCAEKCSWACHIVVMGREEKLDFTDISRKDQSSKRNADDNHCSTQLPVFCNMTFHGLSKRRGYCIGAFMNARDHERRSKQDNPYRQDVEAEPVGNQLGPNVKTIFFA